MPKSTRYGVPDSDSPEWTKERMSKAMRFTDLPAKMQHALAPTKRRGAQRSPTKKAISIRLSADVLAALRSNGRGWQRLVDQTLRDRFVKVQGSPATPSAGSE